MITSTCTTTTCRWHDVARNVLGEPSIVKCGACGEPTVVSDLRPDPPLFDED